MDRRGFLGSILALAAAPAIVRADSLMRIVPTETLVISGCADPALNGEYVVNLRNAAWISLCEYWGRTIDGAVFRALMHDHEVIEFQQRDYGNPNVIPYVLRDEPPSLRIARLDTSTPRRAA